ncbi:MAG TPA: DUF202 domain-containing protein [Thermoplasmataceae archaeon]|nr:DUF202 domain-containing protein [Thermoplasmataceae archaeon]
MKGYNENKLASSVTDHMANERTYLAWVRTGIAVIALGFVVAKFGIIIRELSPTAYQGTTGLSSAVGVLLVIAGAFLQAMALRSFLRNRKAIMEGIYYPSVSLEISMGLLTIVIAVIVVIYLVITL